MKIIYDRSACAGWFQCVQEWSDFQMNISEGKADLDNSEEVRDGVFAQEISAEDEPKARAAVEACPIDAIQLETDTE